ncbi:hypothetical protein DPMN_113346 [Dreissena polymorpha]|uniref:Uncharacterized protein n=1 Tax=Dreissena polymorpha TaxID=45954 RepID=A0A9D4KIW8_DREPO|nr:hypothetical protein DPMN_113346 [Dreissena polymorpha]
MQPIQPSSGMRHFPCTLTSPYYATFCLAPFGGARCTLTSLSAGTLIRIGPLSDEQELSPGSDLVHAFQPSTAYRAELVSGGSFNKNRTYYATSCLAPFGRTRCTLTSRRLPIWLNYDLVHADQPSTAYRAKLDRTYYATFCLAPFGGARCTLTSLSAGTLIRIGPLSDEQELSPGSDLDRTYYATSCLAPFRRTRCTLTSPYYATSCLASFGRTRVIPRKRPSARLPAVDCLSG